MTSIQNDYLLYPKMLWQRVKPFIKHERALFYVYALVFATFPILDTDFHRWLFYILFLPIFFINTTWRQTSTILAQPIFIVLLIFTAYSWLSQFWSNDTTSEHIFNSTRECIFLWIFLISTTVLTLRHRTFLPDALQALVVTAALVALAMTTEAVISAGAWADSPPRIRGFGRGENPIVAALIFSVAIFAAYSCARNRKYHRLLRVASAAAIVPLLCAIALTQSRGPWLAFYSSLIVAAAISRRWLALATLLAFASAAGVLLGAGIGVETGLIERGQGTASRLTLWAQTLEHIEEAPVFGNGWGSDLRLDSVWGLDVKSPHNVYLSVFAFTGAIGMTMFLATIGYALYSASSDVARGIPRVSTLILILGLIANIFDGYFPIQNLGFEWLILWMPVAILIGERMRSGDPRPTQARG